MPIESVTPNSSSTKALQLGNPGLQKPYRKREKQASYLLYLFSIKE
jgi:hypothetical protein